ncbi:hypothetical protein DPMN_055562 [Dreissena polymorpha]|uniref:Uncharacterized protein n=1 Tax=Dreissena polymorpha TaxID=45954 RepID=A0A9D4CSU5_DREPO|nr:hypothetical protein DPMN_055562 [Dreissena polymorpha]
MHSTPRDRLFLAYHPRTPCPGSRTSSNAMDSMTPRGRLWTRSQNSSVSRASLSMSSTRPERSWTCLVSCMACSRSSFALTRASGTPSGARWI